MEEIYPSMEIKQPPIDSFDYLKELDNIKYSLDEFGPHRNNEFLIELLGILGLCMFSLIYFKLNSRNSLIQKFISISWIIFGYKFYLEQSLFNILLYKLNFFNGLINLSLGFMLFFNFMEFHKLKEYWAQNSLFKSFTKSFNFLFLNYSYGVFDIDKIIPVSGNDNIHLFNLILNYVFVGLNTFPLLSNFFIKKNLFNIPFTLFPSPYALATLTLFLNNFRTFYPIHSNFLKILDLLLYSFLIINLVNDIVFLKIFSFENFFFLFLNLLNFIFVFYFDTFGLKSKFKEDLNITNLNKDENMIYYYAGIAIKENPNGDGGIQGFYEREFFIDKFNVVANSFLIFSSKSLSLIEELTVRPVKVDANLIKYIYPRLYN